MLSRELWIRYQSFDHLQSIYGLSPENWLSDNERRESERYHDAGRYRQWQAGRWLAKQLLHEQLVPWSTNRRDIEILSRNAQGQAIRPIVRVNQKVQPWCVSISHSRRGVLVGVSLDPAINVGVDLAEKEDLNSQSLVFWFSARERERLREGNGRHSAVCWAVKEAIYKAINTGESFVPRKFEVFPCATGGYECHHEGKTLNERSHITVWDVDDHVAVTAMVSSTSAPLKNVPHLGGRLERLAPSREAILAGIS
ncbi:MAG: 4'-phosphopantetheinyl transferase superfamily protein [Planctomycetaceae bacterium]|nr:4'-phosphopantetheinyl transferase superfamily protein [Planctomycetaceae bacterium]